jgi:hypothetical protein
VSEAKIFSLISKELEEIGIKKDEVKCLVSKVKYNSRDEEAEFEDDSVFLPNPRFKPGDIIKAHSKSATGGICSTSGGITLIFLREEECSVIAVRTDSRQESIIDLNQYVIIHNC